MLCSRLGLRARVVTLAALRRDFVPKGRLAYGSHAENSYLRVGFVTERDDTAVVVRYERLRAKMNEGRDAWYNNDSGRRDFYNDRSHGC